MIVATERTKAKLLTKEPRLSKFSVEMLLQDLDKSTVDFVPNFDVSTKEPTVMPARVPNLLVNGAQGIAVGVATNIPPHNEYSFLCRHLSNVFNACAVFAVYSEKFGRRRHQKNKKRFNFYFPRK